MSDPYNIRQGGPIKSLDASGGKGAAWYFVGYMQLPKSTQQQPQSDSKALVSSPWMLALFVQAPPAEKIVTENMLANEVELYFPKFPDAYKTFLVPRVCKLDGSGKFVDTVFPMLSPWVCYERIEYLPCNEQITAYCGASGVLCRVYGMKNAVGRLAESTPASEVVAKAIVSAQLPDDSQIEPLKDGLLMLTRQCVHYWAYFEWMKRLLVYKVGGNNNNGSGPMKFDSILQLSKFLYQDLMSKWDSPQVQEALEDPIQLEELFDLRRMVTQQWLRESVDQRNGVSWAVRNNLTLLGTLPDQRDYISHTARETRMRVDAYYDVQLQWAYGIFVDEAAVDRMDDDTLGWNGAVALVTPRNMLDRDSWNYTPDPGVNITPKQFDWQTRHPYIELVCFSSNYSHHPAVWQNAAGFPRVGKQVALTVLHDASFSQSLLVNQKHVIPVTSVKRMLKYSPEIDDIKYIVGAEKWGTLEPVDTVNQTRDLVQRAQMLAQSGKVKIVTSRFDVEPSVPGLGYVSGKLLQLPPPDSAVTIEDLWIDNVISTVKERDVGQSSQIVACLYWRRPMSIRLLMALSKFMDAVANCDNVVLCVCIPIIFAPLEFDERVVLSAFDSIAPEQLSAIASSNYRPTSSSAHNLIADANQNFSSWLPAFNRIAAQMTRRPGDFRIREWALNQATNVVYAKLLFFSLPVNVVYSTDVPPGWLPDNVFEVVIPSSYAKEPYIAKKQKPTSSTHSGTGDSRQMGRNQQVNARAAFMQHLNATNSGYASSSSSSSSSLASNVTRESGPRSQNEGSGGGGIFSSAVIYMDVTYDESGTEASINRVDLFILLQLLLMPDSKCSCSHMPLSKIKIVLKPAEVDKAVASGVTWAQIHQVDSSAPAGSTEMPKSARYSLGYIAERAAYIP